MTTTSAGLGQLVVDAARRSPDAIAVEGHDATLTYAELDEQAGSLAGSLAAAGVGAGDRVALWLPKSARAVVAMQAALRLGAVYVPIDPGSPAARARKIIVDCEARALVMGDDRPSPLGQDPVSGDPSRPEPGPSRRDPVSGDPSRPEPGPSRRDPGELAVAVIGSNEAGSASLEAAINEARWPRPSPPSPDPEDLAYILYTSGSTGTPKGVALSHRAALAFVSWAHELLAATPDDRFSSHAPFHFDLSVLDLYAAFMAGARVCLIPGALAHAPAQLVRFIRERQITIWYSVPSVLIMMMDHGDLLELEAPPPFILFAGEPFAIKHLRRLHERFAPAPASVRLLNLYGPTETNVCTYYEVVDIDPERTTPVPIGSPCCGDEAWAVTGEGRRAVAGESGELMVRGPTTMTGYWGQPPLGEQSYATGDVVRVLEEGVFEYVGRRDHMVKIRGMRIEIGEVEAALHEHGDIHEAAVLVEGAGLSARLVAFLRLEPGAARPSILALKRHCADRLPRYMVIDKAHVLDELPRSRNGKLDRRRLGELVEHAGRA